MSVTVYPRLAELLEEHHLTLAELEGRIATQFGSAVDTQGLVRLAESTPVRQADLELAGATAAVLGVGLDDLFTVAAFTASANSGSSRMRVKMPSFWLRRSRMASRKAVSKPNL